MNKLGKKTVTTEIIQAPIDRDRLAEIIGDAYLRGIENGKAQ